jgi:hypothetical protein
VTRHDTPQIGPQRPLLGEQLSSRLSSELSYEARPCRRTVSTGWCSLSDWTAMSHKGAGLRPTEHGAGRRTHSHRCIRRW